MADLTNQLQAAAGAATPVTGGWDLANAFVFTKPSGDVGDLVKSFTFNAGTQETVVRGSFLKPDGTKLYVIGSGNDSVHEYNLSKAWNLSTTSFVQSFSVASQEAGPLGVFFKPDGTKMYITGTTTNDAVYEYSLSSAWNVSTCSYVQNFSVTTQDITPWGIWFKPDGTRMYIMGNAGDDVNEYSLSTAWNISTASYVQNFSVATQETNPTGLSFNSDGTKMYVAGSIGDDINEYTLSSAWDISTASFTKASAVFGNIQGLFVDDVNSIFVYTEGNTINSAFLGQSFSVAAQETGPYALFFKPDGTKMYVTGTTGDDVNEYSLSTAWDVSTASFVQSFSVASQTATPYGLFFKDDGTKMYVVTNNVYEYSLSVAWDVSSASYTTVSTATSGSAAGIYIKPDGTKMYLVDYTSDAIDEYSLSTPWDVSTDSFVQSFSVAAQDTQPIGMYMKPDGTKMYVTGTVGDDVLEYSLSTPWDVSTASYVQNFVVEDTAPYDIYIRSDGKKFWIMGSGSDTVYTYSM